jgi:hypothetical protein
MYYGRLCVQDPAYAAWCAQGGLDLCTRAAGHTKQEFSQTYKLFSEEMMWQTDSSSSEE